jgi:hydroxymethylbilane synthase
VSSPALRIGTRASALALWQANRVAELIRAQPGAPAVELVHIRTEGDLRTDIPLWAAGGRAFFTREIDRAQLEGEVDLAVHSLKDLSTQMAPGLQLGAVLEREDPRDALLTDKGATLEGLPPGARVGTSSLRRRAFLCRARPDLTLLELRGNVPTRLERLQQGRYDAIVLATAGLKRLDLAQHIATRIEPAIMPPAVSQGAIGVCAREGDESALRWLRALDHAVTRVAVTAERALLRRIEGGCQVPLGALAILDGARLTLNASVCALDGTVAIDCGEWAMLGADLALQPQQCAAQLAAATALGVRVADQLLARGAADIIARQRTPASGELP